MGQSSWPAKDKVSVDARGPGTGRAKLRRAVKGRLYPVGGRYPTRQLTFQPEAVEATSQSDLEVEALDAKGSCKRISERADHNEN